MNYGISYQGSKATIAQSIIKFLPKGKRLVDLFGGGGAITHCAELSHKWNSVLYNEINPLLVDLINKAINGDYNYRKFRPEFITKEKFNELKDKDGYVKYIWSFSNAGQDYLFGIDTEHYKHLAHDLVIFGKKSNELEKLFPGVNYVVKGNNFVQRRLQFQSFVRNCKRNKRFHIELQRLLQLERLERLQQLEKLQQLLRLERLQQLERLGRLQQLEIQCGDYRDFVAKEGDIIYCDPPYENTCSYNDSKFNHKEFYNWSYVQKLPVFFSSYTISDTRFEMVWVKQKYSLMAGSKYKKIKNECIYANKAGMECLQKSKV